ncbi:MAG: transglycosylase SLT domain-containing protein [Oligoflexia bacterium]|nr:transglycosylase SLT domain-containing protein [Oligoflexia bacterium]
MSEIIQQSEIPPPKALAGADNSSNAPAERTTIVVNSVENPTEISVNGVRLKNVHFDFPVTINSSVEYWVDYFTGRGRPFFAKYLDRSEYFIPYIRPILAQNHLPEDLVYLAMIESGFNNFARSHAKAVGPWQFITATGRRYGLMVNWWVDERRDIKKSSFAAVEYLAELNTMFNSWELAAAAYNAGEGKIARAIQRYGTKDFWVLAKHRFLRRETRDYVPKIIAAALIAKNRTQFGFPSADAQRPSAGEVVAGDGEVVKVIKTEKPEEKIEAGESEKVGDLISKVSEVSDMAGDDQDDEDADSDSGPRVTPATLLVPVDNSGGPEGGREGIQANAGNQPLAKSVPTPHVSKNGEVGGDALAEFDVQSPADLLKVARAAGLSYQTVKSLNPELLRWCTPPSVGAYRIRLPASVRERFLATYNQSAFPREVKFMTYKVHRGETLKNIARRFGIKVDPISDLNGLSANRPLRSGLSVVLPMPNDRSRSLASLEVRDPPEHSGRRRRRRGRYSRISYRRRESARILRSSRHDG